MAGVERRKETERGREGKRDHVGVAGGNRKQAYKERQAEEGGEVQEGRRVVDERRAERSLWIKD